MQCQGKEGFGFRKGTNPGIRDTKESQPLHKACLETRLCLLGATSQTILRIFVWELSQEPERHMVKKYPWHRGNSRMLIKSEKDSLSQIWQVKLLVELGNKLVQVKRSPDCVVIRGASCVACKQTAEEVCYSIYTLSMQNSPVKVHSLYFIWDAPSSPPYDCELLLS